LLYGLGLSMVVAPITAAALTTIPERQAGIAAGINTTCSRLGSLAATAVLGLVVSLVFAARTDNPNLVPLTLGQQGQEFITGSTDGFRAAMILAATLALVGAGTALGLSRRAATAAPDVSAASLLPARLDPSAPDCPSAVPLTGQPGSGSCSSPTCK
jgi:MFS family permease